jgi:hypothetical protein
MSKSVLAALAVIAAHLSLAPSTSRPYGKEANDRR